MGALTETGITSGLDKEAFSEEIVDILLSFSDVKTMIGPRAGLPTPMGLAVVEIPGHKVQPHAVWFPWASKRNKLECAACYLSDLRRSRDVDGRVRKGMIFAPEDTWVFFTHLMRRGILGRCGKLPRWFDDGAPAMLFYTRELE